MPKTYYSDNSTKYRVSILGINETFSHLIELMTKWITLEMIEDNKTYEDNALYDMKCRERAQNLKLLQGEIVDCKKKLNKAKSDFDYKIERLKIVQELVLINICLYLIFIKVLLMIL